MAKKKMTLEEKLEEAIVKDVPYEVPENWVWVKLGDYIDYATDYVANGSFASLKENIQVYKDENYALMVKTKDFNNNFSKDLTYTDQKGYEFLGKSKLFGGELILSNVGSIGKVFRVPYFNRPMTLASNSIMLKCHNELDYDYLYYLLLSPVGYNLLMSITTGTAVMKFNKTGLKLIPVPLPPLKEQQRIVDRIESLFEKLDKSKELIEEARDGFEKRKQSLLEKAFRGELTREWRRKNHFENNTLKLLLEQNNNIKKKFEFSQAEKLFNLPDEWRWIKLKDTCEKFKYGTSSKSKEDGLVPVLRMGNLQNGYLDWTNLVYTSDEQEIKKYDLKFGDLLFNRTNSPELVGKTSIYEGEREAIFAGYLIRVRVLDGIHSKYINYFMNSIFAKYRCMEVKSDGVSQSNINAEKLGDFDIPLPSLEEQIEIVRILDKLLGDESKIEELTKLEEQIELIKKSILAKAFRGNLGTNCEEDESALELLKEVLSKDL